MNIDSVLVGFTKNGDRCLLYKQTSDDENNSYIYYDLINNTIIPTSLIDCDKLLPIKYYRKRFESIKNITVKSAIKTFNKDNNTYFDVSKLAYYNMYKQDGKGKLQLIKKELLCAKYCGKSFELYKDINSNRIISSILYNAPNIVYDLPVFVRSINIDKPKVLKKELLEMDYRKEL